MTDGVKGTSIAPAPKDLAKEEKPVYKLAEIRSDGTAVIEMEDNRMFLATIKEGLAVHKRAKVTIKAEGEDTNGVPTGAEVVGIESAS